VSERDLDPTTTATASATPLLSERERALCQRFDPLTHDSIAFFVARFRKRPLSSQPPTTSAVSAATDASASAAAATATDPESVRSARRKRKELEKERKAAAKQKKLKTLHPSNTSS
jgi:hypothetical protein